MRSALFIEVLEVAHLVLDRTFCDRSSARKRTNHAYLLAHGFAICWVRVERQMACVRSLAVRMDLLMRKRPNEMQRNGPKRSLMPSVELSTRDLCAAVRFGDESLARPFYLVSVKL